MSDTIIHTRRLTLRPWRESDAETLYRYAKDPAVGTPAGWPAHRSAAESLDVIRTVFSAPEVYAVVPKPSDEPVGSCGIMTGDMLHSACMGPDDAEIGYWIAVPYWGQGMIPEAVDALLDRCFRELGHTTVWIGYYDGNDKSRRVAEKCGFEYHHTAPPAPSPLGDIRTEHFMRLTKERYERSRR